MTLLHNFNIGGIVNIIACDTRQFSTFFNKPWADADNKINTLSPRTISTGGGYNLIVEFIQKELEALQLEYWHEYWKPFKDIIARVEEKFAKQLGNGICAQFIICGMGRSYNEAHSGETGLICYNSEAEPKISNEMLSRGELRRMVASPSDKMFRSAEENVEQPSFDEIEDTEEVMRQAIEYMADFQLHMYEMDETTVSDTFCYHAIRWDPIQKKHIQYKDKIKLTG